MGNASQSRLDDVILRDVENNSSHSTSGGKTNHASTPLLVKELGDRGRKTVLNRLAHGDSSARRDDEGGELLIGEVEGVLLLGLGSLRSGISTLGLGSGHL